MQYPAMTLTDDDEFGLAMSRLFFEWVAVPSLEALIWC